MMIISPITMILVKSSTALVCAIIADLAIILGLQKGKQRFSIVGIIKILGYIADAGVLILLFSIFKPNVFFVGLGSLARESSASKGNTIRGKSVAVCYCFSGLSI